MKILDFEKKCLPPRLQINRRFRKDLLQDKKAVSEECKDIYRRVDKGRFEGQCDLARARDTRVMWIYESYIADISQAHTTSEIKGVLYRINKSRNMSYRRW